MHDENSFLTLTYDSAKLPVHGTLVPEHMTLFMKKLRKAHCVYGEDESGERICENPISYFYCGEYGAVCPYCRERHTFGRPHYHALVFGYWPSDGKVHKRKGNVTLFTSDELARIWGNGFVTVGAVTPQSAGYCTRYSLKKCKGRDAPEHYQRLDCRDGELHPIQPEFARMSRNPALGKRYYDAYGEEVYGDGEDSVVINGMLLKPPRYYDELFRDEDEEAYESMKAGRRAAAKEHAHNNTPERLAARKKCHDARLARLKRSYENE